MEKSQSIQNLAKALLVFNTKVNKIKKDASNPFFNSKYASLSNIQEEIAMPLAESGLVLTQFPTETNGLTTLLIHAESGEYLQSNYIMQPVKNDPQSLGSAITYQKRYSICAVLGLNIDDDDDGNKASGNNTETHKSGNTESKDEKPWLNKGTNEFKGALSKLSKGETTIEKIEQSFRLSKVITEELKKAIK